MKSLIFPVLLVILAGLPAAAHAEDLRPLREALTFHASFDASLNAEFSKGTTDCTIQQGTTIVPAAPNEDVLIASNAGRFGNALHFTNKSKYWPQFLGDNVLNYNTEDWSTTVSVWLRLTPDEDLEPGYCDPIQIVGDDSKKGFIFLEWSKDHSPRRFRYAIRPLVEIWNPENVGWEEIPDDKRPMVQLTKPVFSREQWTHVVFTLEHINSTTAKPSGCMYIDGELQGTIENWDLRFGWDPARVRLVLGASYVGQLDDLSVFNRALTPAEVQQLHQLPQGATMLHQ